MNVIPMHAAPRRPAAAVIATLLAGGYAVYYAYVATSGFLDHDALAVGAILEVLIWGVLLAGLWRGSNLAYVLVTIAAILTVAAAAPALSDLDGPRDAILPGLRLAFGVTLLVFLLLPQSSRAFYARRAR